jgi:hypothetical protein
MSSRRKSEKQKETYVFIDSQYLSIIAKHLFGRTPHYLIACDTDFVPVLNRIRKEHNVEVILYYFTDKIRRSRFSMSNHILTACDKTVLLKREHFEQNMMSQKEKAN